MRKALSIPLILAILAIGLVAGTSSVLGVAFSLGDDLDGGGPGAAMPNSIWETGYYDYACNGDYSGSTIDDADLDPDGETTVGNQSDAFDDALQLIVDAAAFDDADDTGDLISGSSGNALTLGPETMSGMNVSLEWKALASSATLRSLATFVNPTGSDVNAVISWESNVGSDDETAVHASSSGDTTLTAADRGVITSDDPVTPSDPVNTFVFFGPGSPASPATVAVLENDDCVRAGFDITVPAGETRYLLFFNQLNQTNEEALTGATGFDTNPALESEYMSGLTGDQLPAVLNWNFGQVATPTPSPSPSPSPSPPVAPTSAPTPTLAPAALPPTGGSPSSTSGLPLAAIIAIAGLGIAAVTSFTIVTTRRAR